MRSGTIFLAYSLTHLFHQSGRVRVVVKVPGCLCRVRISSASFWPENRIQIQSVENTFTKSYQRVCFPSI